MKVPVIFIVFNRPDLTAKVFETIRDARPKQLLVVADGPRLDRLGEAELCLGARSVVEKVDWPCEVLRDYSDVNLGCRRRVSSGLTWAFRQVPEAIVLEDDCLPDPSFFPFCEEMLALYREDLRIMMITGTNFSGEWKVQRQSYHFACSGSIWGWASWRRAWAHYDVNMARWNDQEVRDRLRDVYCDERAFELRRPSFDEVAAGQLDTWDYQWTFARLTQSGLSIVPSRNLISNIGFRGDATHTKSGVPHGNGSRQELSFPLIPPPCVVPDRDYERRLTDLLSDSVPVPSQPQGKKSLLRRLWNSVAS